MQKQWRNSQETTVQPWGRVLVPHGIYITIQLWVLQELRPHPGRGQNADDYFPHQRSNCQHPLDHWKKQESSQKNICFIDYVFECVDQNKVWKILKEMGIPDYLTCFLRNLYESQKATVRTRHGTTAGSKLGKEFVKAVYCHPAYLTYAEYIMWNAGQDEAQAGIKIARRNINNLRYADNTTPMAENEELKSLLMKWKRRVKILT